jgi:hypothetical protein
MDDAAAAHVDEAAILAARYNVFGFAARTRSAV